MTPDELMAAFEAVAEAPDGVARLRELVLELAVRGRLVPQDPADEPAMTLLGQIENDMAQRGGRLRAARRSEVGARETIEQFDLPSNWAWSVVERCTSFVRRGKSPTYDDRGGIPVVSQKCVQWSGFDLARARSISDSSIARYEDEQFLQEGDLLWNSTGLGTLGRIVPYRPRPEHPRVVVDSHVTVVRPHRCAARYLWFWFAGPVVQNVINQLATGSTKQTELATKAVEALPVPLPPLAEQHRIVARVDELMGLLDRLEAARAARDATRAAVRDSVLDALREADTPDEVEVAWTRVAERMDDLLCDPADIAPLRQTVLQLAVRGRLVPQDPTDEPASESVQSARRQAGRRPFEACAKPAADEAFATPRGWTWTSIGDIAELRLGKMLDKAKNVGRPQPYLRNTNVRWFRFELGSVKEMRVEDSELAELRLRPGDLLICEGGHGIARSAVWRGELDHVVFQKALHRARPLACLDSDFLSYCLRTQEAAGHLQRHYTGAGIPHFTGRALARVVIPLPPRDEQRRIVARVDELMGLLDRLEARLAAAQVTHAAFVTAALHQVGD